MSRFSLGRYRWIGIEVKTATGKQRDAQKRFHAAIKVVGDFYAIARSPEQAVECLKAL